MHFGKRVAGSEAIAEDFEAPNRLEMSLEALRGMSAKAQQRALRARAAAIAAGAYSGKVATHSVRSFHSSVIYTLAWIGLPFVIAFVGIECAQHDNAQKIAQEQVDTANNTQLAFARPAPRMHHTSKHRVAQNAHHPHHSKRTVLAQK